MRYVKAKLSVEMVAESTQEAVSINEKDADATHHKDACWFAPKTQRRAFPILTTS